MTNENGFLFRKKNVVFYGKSSIKQPFITKINYNCFLVINEKLLTKVFKVSTKASLLLV